MKPKELKSGELYKILFLWYSDLYDYNGKTIHPEEEVKKYQFKIVLLLEPKVIVDTDRGIDALSKILVDNNIFYIRSNMLYNLKLPKEYENFEF